MSRKGLGEHSHSLLLRLHYFGRNHCVEWSGSITKLVATSGSASAAPYHQISGPTDGEASIYASQHLLRVLSALRDRFELTLFPLFDVEDALTTAYRAGALGSRPLRSSCGKVPIAGQ